jgi:hypothetical protein
VIAIAVRAVLTVAELLFVGLVTLVGRHEAWSGSRAEMTEEVRGEARAVSPRAGSG